METQAMHVQLLQERRLEEKREKKARKREERARRREKEEREREVSVLVDVSAGLTWLRLCSWRKPRDRRDGSTEL